MDEAFRLDNATNLPDASFYFLFYFFFLFPIREEQPTPEYCIMS